jgi:hypothetical protein
MPIPCAAAKGGNVKKKALILGTLVLVLAVGAVPVAAITWGIPDTEHIQLGAMVVDWPDYGPYRSVPAPWSTPACS